MQRAVKIPEHPAVGNPVMVAETELRAGALRLPGVLVQGLTHMAPATALLFTIQFTTTQAGMAAPLAYLSAFPIVLVLGVCLTQLARYLPSAGGYYTYISMTVHPRVGFLAAWLYFLYDPMLVGFILAFLGSVIERALKAAYGVTFPWWLFLLVSGSFVGFVTYRGIKVSAKWMVFLGAADLSQAVHDTETKLPKKHLVAQEVEGPLGGPVDFSQSPLLSIIAGQYVLGGEADSEPMGGMKGLDYMYGDNKPIELNESAYCPMWYQNTDPVASSRVEAWEFIVGGGASFNHLNSRYTVEDPAGNTR